MELFDYIIVGSGAAGSILANLLPGTKKVLERGSRHDVLSVKCAEFLESTFVQEINRSMLLVAPCCVGGGPFVNGKLLCFGFEKDYLFSFEILQDALAYGKQLFGGNLTTKEELLPIPASVMNTIMAKSLKNQSDQIFYTEEEGFILSSFLHPDRVFFPPKVILEECFTVTSVLIENGTAVGVEGHDSNSHIKQFRAKKVVLSAGALHTPSIMHFSGIENNYIGETLRDHYIVTIAYNVPELQPSSRSFEQMSIFLKSCSESDIDCQIRLCTMQTEFKGEEFKGIDAKEGTPIFTFGIGLNSTDEEGCIVWKDGAPFYHIGPTANDIMKIANAIMKIDLILKDNPFFQDRLSPPKSVSQEEIISYIKANIKSQIHYNGTCPFGKVVNNKFESLDIKNLFIVDASVLHVNPRVNTMGPVMLNALVFCKQQTEEN